MTKDEVLKLALGIARSMFAADDAYGCGYYNDPSWRAAYRELRKITQEALAHAPTEQEQPAQQEPVACVGTNGELMWLNKSKVIYSKPIPLYTTPPQRTWEELTQQDIDIAFDDTQEGGGFDDFARAIEATLKRKNT